MSTKSWLNDIAKALQKKLKTNEKILPSQFSEKIMEITSGGGGGATMVIEHPGEKVGTPIPTSGVLNTVYFDTSLSIDETVSILSNGNIPFDDGKYLIANTSDGTFSLALLNQTGMCALVGNNGQLYFHNVNEYEAFLGFVGWNPEISSIEVNLEIVGGDYNNLIANVVSSLPFVEKPGEIEEIEIEGELNGNPVTITEQELKGSWQGAPVPNTGYVENVYFNTNLSDEEISNLLSQLTYIKTNIEVYPMLTTSDNKIMIVAVNSVLIVDMVKMFSGEESSAVYWVGQNYDGLIGQFDFRGWNPNLINPLFIGQEIISSMPENPTTVLGAENELISSLFSTTPFDKTEKNTIDILKYIEEEKLPNKINLKIEDKFSPYFNGMLTVFSSSDVTFLRSAAFAYQFLLQSVYLPKCNEIPTETFKECKNLISVDIPKCSRIGLSAFHGCEKLSSATFPLCTWIAQDAFAFCSNLSVASFPVCSSIGRNAFSDAYSLNQISFPCCIKVESGVFTGTKLTEINLPACVSVSSSAFYNCNNLTSINLPTCKSIYNGTFSNCINLQTINIPQCRNINPFAFTNISVSFVVHAPLCVSISASAFENTTIKEITFSPNTIYSSTFYNCQKLQSVYLLYSANNLNNADAFYNTPMSVSSYIGSFGSIFVPSDNVSRYQSATNWAVYSSRFAPLPSEYDAKYVYCWQFDRSSIAEIPSEKSNVEYILERGFYYCSKLTTLSFPSCTYIASSAFTGCSSLTTISFPMCEGVGYGAFAYCSSLTSIEFPKCITIETSAFYSCSNLTTASFPECVYIGNGAFASCTNLSSLYLVNSSKMAFVGGYYATDLFYNTPIANGTGKIYVHANQYENYINSFEWGALSSQFVSVTS